MKTIFHLDLDAFFVSVERIIDPSLIGKPVIVGADPDGRGVVAACSYEAREYGLHSAMPIRTAYKLCPNGIYLQGHHHEYPLFSEAVKNILEIYAPQIEQASIDEFYMDFTGCQKFYGSLFFFATKLQKEIKEKLSLPCSIGIGTNKTIAKIASDCMKPMGITYVMPGLEKEFLAPMPIEAIPGVGKVTQQQLNERGFYSIGDISKTSEDYFITLFGKYGSDIWLKANGLGNDFLNPPHQQKSISKETTYDKDETNKTKIEKTIFYLVGKICQSLRDENLQAGKVSIKLRYSDFQTITRDITIEPTDDDKTIYDTAIKLFRKAYTRRVSIRLIGVKLSKFSLFSEQEELFSQEELKRKRMFRAINKLRNKFGFSSIQFGNLDNE